MKETCLIIILIFAHYVSASDQECQPFTSVRSHKWYFASSYVRCGNNELDSWENNLCPKTSERDIICSGKTLNVNKDWTCDTQHPWITYSRVSCLDSKFDSKCGYNLKEDCIVILYPMSDFYLFMGGISFVSFCFVMVLCFVYCNIGKKRRKKSTKKKKKSKEKRAIQEV